MTQTVNRVIEYQRVPTNQYVAPAGYMGAYAPQPSYGYGYSGYGAGYPYGYPYGYPGSAARYPGYGSQQRPVGGSAPPQQS